MILQADFLKKFNITEDEFAKTALDWQSLTKIYDDYLNYREEIEPSATYIFTALMKASKVHSVRYRIKNPEHVIEKIIRKKLENNDSDINLENYKIELKDLIGLRAIHLFKDDWLGINEFIRKTWNLNEPVVANYRKGDSEQLINIFKEKGCEVKEHKYGYRSIHYIIETQPGIQKHFAEIQVRTIFEEAWSEIDHTVRYPYDLDNPIFSQFLLILNRLAGGADEMGSFIRFLQKDLADREREFNSQIEEKQQTITALEQKIEKLNLQGEELASVKQDLDKLRSNQHVSLYSNNYARTLSDLLAQRDELAIRRTGGLADIMIEGQTLVRGMNASLELTRVMTQNKEMTKEMKATSELVRAMRENKGL